MRITLILLLFLIFSSCNKPRTVLICGDHICINKTEAEQYFEENLTIEVRIIDEKTKDNVDLVELNLQENLDGKRKISIASKPKTSEPIKKLSKDEINEIKEKIKNKKKVKEVIKKKKIEKNKIINKKQIKKNEKNKIKDIEIKSKNFNKLKKDLVYFCTIIEKFSIDEIYKYLEKQGKKEAFQILRLDNNLK